MRISIEGCADTLEGYLTQGLFVTTVAKNQIEFWISEITISEIVISFFPALL